MMMKKVVNKTEKNMYRYGLQEKFCRLYEQSKQGNIFKHLMKFVVSEENIILAYRNICKNKGSFTPGVDGKTIEDIQKYPIQVVAQKVRNKLIQYQPKQVRRVLIPKGNGKMRPLGIPSIWDRLIQQCFLQVLEPICEAKFHERSKEIVKYDLGNLTVWDTPGLGDGVEEDKSYTQQIVRKLSETDGDGNLLIDLVLVVLDAGSRDLSVSYDVINNVLIPCLGKDNTHRILIVLNQSDMAMKGRHWDYDGNAPDDVLRDFLIRKAESVKRRVKEATGITVEPVYYCAGYTDEDGNRQAPYNLSKLLYYILTTVPAEKRLVLADNLNGDEENWSCNDYDYSDAVTGAVADGFFASLTGGVCGGAERGAEIGSYIIGLPGVLFGGLLGGIFGGLHALVVKPLSNFKLF